jgi:uncharacterized membrane protein
MHMENNQQTTDVLDTSRVEALSDSVFAVAITLLILTIQLPSSLGVTSTAPLAQALVQVMSSIGLKLLSYVLSFVIVGIYWVGHQYTFHYIKRSDRVLLWLNLLLLLCIVFIPFPTMLPGTFWGKQFASVI